MWQTEHHYTQLRSKESNLVKKIQTRIPNTVINSEFQNTDTVNFVPGKYQSH